MCHCYVLLQHVTYSCLIVSFFTVISCYYVSLFCLIVTCVTVRHCCAMCHCCLSVTLMTVIPYSAMGHCCLIAMCHCCVSSCHVSLSDHDLSAAVVSSRSLSSLSSWNMEQCKCDWVIDMILPTQRQEEFHTSEKRLKACAKNISAFVWSVLSRGSVALKAFIQVVLFSV